MSDRKYSVASNGSKIDAFLQPVLKHARLKVDYEMADAEPTADAVETPDLVLRFSGPDVDHLLANKAELLLALEHLTMEALRMPSEDHSRLCFDANDWRLLRIEELRLSAAAAAEKVKRTGVPFRFNPMNSRERRVIHMSLRDDAAVRSESAGAGPGRQVVVYPAGMPSLPESAAPPPPFARPERRGGGRSRGARR